MNRKEQVKENSAAQDVQNIITFAFGQGDWITELDVLCAEIASIHQDMAMKNPVDKSRISAVFARLAGVNISMGMDQEYQSSKEQALQRVTQSVQQLHKDFNAYVNPPKKKLSRSELRAIQKAAEAEHKKIDRLSDKVDVAAVQASDLPDQGKEISAGLKETNKGVKSLASVVKGFVSETIPNLIAISKRKAEVRKEDRANKRMGWTKAKLDKSLAKENEVPSEDRKLSK